MIEAVRLVRRFFALIALGLIVAQLVGIGLVYRVSLEWPPTFTEREQPTYFASTELLVDSHTGPYLRATTRQVVAAPPLRSREQADRPAAGDAQTPARTTTTGTLVPETKTLVDAANLFPLLIEADEVTAVRRRLIGDVPGAVRAKALYALQGENRFRPSVLPVVQIAASAPRPKHAILLAQGTARAFRIWLTREQQKARVPESQRIVVRQLRVPQGAAAVGGASYGLPLLAALAVLGAFIGLAVVLDRARPRPLRAPPVRVETGQEAEHGRGSWDVAPANSTSSNP